MLSAKEYLRANTYPGRGVFLGLTPNGLQAIAAYFIMGRSENSRNRVFTNDGLGLKTAAHDPAKLTDPSLVIYNALRVFGPHTIVTNGDQTDTIYQAFCHDESFQQALRTRVYEPDAPHFTPRISGLLTVTKGQAGYKLSIIKNGGNESCLRFFYEYPVPQRGIGHLLHTYMGDGNPLPSFTGEPVALPTADDIQAFTEDLWEGLNKENRVALHTRYIKLEDGSMQTCTCHRFSGEQTTEYHHIGV